MRKAPQNRFSERYPLLHRVNRARAWTLNENDEQATNALFQRQSVLLRDAADFLPLAPLYLNSSQHDGQIVSVEKTAREFTIWMEDESVRFLSELLETITGERVRNSRDRFLIGFKFNEVSSLSISRISGNDKILPICIPRYLPRLGEFHYDEVTRISPGFLSMGMLTIGEASRGSSYDMWLVEVQCRTLEFVEGQRAPFEALFGNRYPGLYDTFHAARRENLQYFDSSKICKFVSQEVGRHEATTIQVG